MAMNSPGASRKTTSAWPKRLPLTAPRRPATAPSPRRILADFTRAVRANAPALLAATARLVRDPDAPAETRAEFAELLARAVEQMPAASARRQ